MVCVSPFAHLSDWNSGLTVCVIRMSLIGTWCQCILRVDTAAGTLAGRERLGCPQASMGRLLYEVNPLRYLDARGI